MNAAMTIYMGSDHAGLELKQDLRAYLESKGFKIIDLGVFKVEPVDYPEIAREVSEKVEENPTSRGILVCGTGIGMCMAANKMKGIRAANCESVATAEMSRKHNDANVLCLGGRVLEPALAHQMVDVFMNTAFEGGRHVARVAKIEPTK